MKMEHPILLHTKLASHIFNNFPKHKTPLLSVYSLPTCHLSHPNVQAMKNNNFIIEDKSYWDTINSKIEDYLARAIPIQEPLNVFEPMRDLAFDGPRSMAPALCIAACELVGGYGAQAIPVASALHVMHAAVRAHEYLLLTHRPSPTNHANRVYSSSIELQTGVGLLSFGYELLARLDHSYEPKDSGRILRVITEVSRAMGGLGVVAGQYREVECCKFDNEEACQEGLMYEKKSGELYACGAGCGAILGEASEEEIEKLRKYGLYVGTIQGLLHVLDGNNDKERNETIQHLRELAFKELEGFEPEKIDSICSLLNVGDVK